MPSCASQALPYGLLHPDAGCHVQITGRRGNAVLVAEDDWRAVQETLHLLFISGMRESIREGMATPVDELDGKARLVSWRLYFTKQTQKDARKLAAAGLHPKAEALLAVSREDPLQSPPPFEQLVGDLRGACSKRVAIQHRLVYQVLLDEHAVKIVRMWTHYD
jgi:Txe/YoeB family toxin of toxin-antitoxin system